MYVENHSVLFPCLGLEPTKIFIYMVLGDTDLDNLDEASVLDLTSDTFLDCVRVVWRDTQTQINTHAYIIRARAFKVNKLVIIRSTAPPGNFHTCGSSKTPVNKPFYTPTGL